jgi:peptide-methionine (R)-S-oxide reductase
MVVNATRTFARIAAVCIAHDTAAPPAKSIFKFALFLHNFSSSHPFLRILIPVPGIQTPEAKEPMKYLLLLLSLATPLLLVACGSNTAGSAAITEPATMPASSANNDAFPVTHTDAEWRKILTPEQYAVLREKDTDPAFAGKYDNFYQPGTYSCAACGQELFTSDTKFNAGCGWPAFYAAKAGDRVKLVHDFSFGMDRTEVLCARCGSHLGHLFDDAPDTPTGQRFCINSTSIIFTPATTTSPAPKK